MEAASDDPRLGTTLDGRYRLIEQISQGSMGVVYRAERVKLGRIVAVKFLHGPFASDPQFVSRFEREARVMSRIAHPNCVSVIDVGMADAPYVVMEYVTGQTLRDLIERGPVPAARAVAITRQILAGLAHAHGHGVVHRDVKSANVMLSEATGTGDHVRLLDFGLATLLNAAPADFSQSQIVVGTPSYMAPEQSRGDKVDGKADVYATAVLLFELLAGKKPFAGESAYDLIQQHREAEPPRVAEVAPLVLLPAGLEDVLRQALHKDPAARPGPIELSRALEDVVRGDGRTTSGIGTADTVSMDAAAEPAPAPASAGRGGLVAMLLILVVLGGGAALAWKAGVLELGGGDGRRAAARPVESERDRSPRASRAAASPPPVADPGDPADPAVLAAAAPDAGAPAGDGGPLDGDAGAEELELTFSLDGGDDPDRDAGVEAPLPPTEQEEPVEALPETAELADRSEPTTVDEVERTPPPRRVDKADTLDEALALIKAKRRDEAIAALRIVRAGNRKSAYVPYLLGNLYFERRWWTVGMEHYKEAIANNRVYRSKAVLNRNVVRALGDGRTARAASALIQRSIGSAALPYLDRAAQHDANKQVRRRAAYLAKVLRKKRR